MVRKRLRFSEQLSKLEEIFGYTPYITLIESKILAKGLRLNVKHVLTWFRNRRSKQMVKIEIK
jgi:hypothetical protein